MRYWYRIYHREEGKSPVERAMHTFSDEQKVREYSFLPSYIAQCLHGSEITAIFTPADVKSDGVMVEVESEQSEDKIDSYLAKCLVELNYQIKGLCLVIDKHAPK